MVDEPLSVKEVEKMMAKCAPNEAYYVLDLEGAVLGWGVIKRFGTGSMYQFAGETSVFLRRSEIRKGYGSQIKQVLIDECRRLGYHHLVARVWASNTASIAYNERFGYDVVGIQREIGFMDGAWRDVALMQLVL